jgi:hypothetical protein
MINFVYGPSPVKIEKFWTDFKEVVTTKSLPMQYEEDNTKYYLYAIDGDVLYLCFVYKNALPTPPPTGYTQAQSDLDKTNFVNKYKSKAGILPNTPPTTITGDVNLNASGLAQESTLQSIKDRLPLALGPQSQGTSLSVVLASGSTPLAVAGNLTASPPSVGPTNSSIPTQADLIGAKDSTGKLQPLNVADDGTLKVSGSFTTTLSSIYSDGWTAAGTTYVNVSGVRTTNGNFVAAKSDNSGNQIVVGLGILGSPGGGVLTVQGDPTGRPIPVSIPSVTSANNTAAPTSSLLMAGKTTGGNSVPLAVDSSGNLSVSVSATGLDNSSVGATNFTVPAKATLIGGYNATANKMYGVAVNASGQLVITGTGTSGEVVVSGSTLAQHADMTAISAVLPTARGPQAQANSLSVCFATGASPLSVTFSNASMVVTQTDQTQLKSTVYQTDQTQLKSTVYQTDPTQLKVTANIGSISGSGIATETTLSAINTKLPPLGQTDSAHSIPVVLATGQSLTVNGTINASSPAVGVIASQTPPTSASFGGALAPNGTLVGVKADVSGNQVVIGAGTAGFPNAGVVTVQGVSGGKELPVVIGSTSTVTVVQPIQASLKATVYGSGTAVNGGITETGVLTIQGNPGGVAVPISGNITANNESVGTNVHIIPTSSTLIAGSNAGTLTPISVDSSGKVNITGSITANPANVANRSADVTIMPSGLIGANNGGILIPVSADSNGNQVIVGAGTAGSLSGGVLTVQGDPSGKPIPVSTTQLPTTIGQAAAAQSLSVVYASGSTLPVSVTFPGSTVVTQGTATNLKSSVEQTTQGLLNATVFQPNQANLLATVYQGTAANLKATVIGGDTAGTISTNVVTIQGNASGVPVPVSGTINANVTFPASLPVTQGTATNLKSSVEQTNQGLLNATVYQTDQTALKATVYQGTAANLKATVIGGDTAGTISTNVVTIQGNASGVPVPVSGSITANNNSVSTTGNPAPGSATLIGGTNGTNLIGIKVDSSGVVSTTNATIVGSNDTLTIATQKYNLIAGVTSLTAPSISSPIVVDNTGAVKVSGTISANNDSVKTITTPLTLTGGSPNSSATLIGGYVSSGALAGQLQPLSLDSGRSLVTTNYTISDDGTVVASLITDKYKASVIGGIWDNSGSKTVKALSVDSNGKLNIVGSITANNDSVKAIAASLTLTGGSPNSSATLIGGSKSGFLQPLLLDGSGYLQTTNTSLNVDGFSLPTTPLSIGTTVIGGVYNNVVAGTKTLKALNVDSSGNLNVVGTITANNNSVSTTGNPAPGSATLIGGTNGTNLIGIKVDSSGVVSTTNATIVGSNDAIATQKYNLLAGVSTLTAGVPSGFTNAVVVDNTGAMKISGSVTANNDSVGSFGLSASIQSKATLICGSDGSHPYTIKTANDGSVYVINDSVKIDGATPTSYTVMAGTYNSKVKPLALNIDGTLTANNASVISTASNPISTSNYGTLIGGITGGTTFKLLNLDSSGNVTVNQGTGWSFNPTYFKAAATPVGASFSGGLTSSTTTPTSLDATTIIGNVQIAGIADKGVFGYARAVVGPLASANTVANYRSGCTGPTSNAQFAQGIMSVAGGSVSFKTQDNPSAVTMPLVAGVIYPIMVTEVTNLNSTADVFLFI